MDILNRDDRIGKYLVGHLDAFIFDELSDSYLQKAGIADILTGVPIPLKKAELSNISTLSIALNMAFILGVDPFFQYSENYVSYIIRTFGKEFANGLIGDGVKAAEKNDYEYACIRFRGAIRIDAENVDAVYCYGRACKDAYEHGGEEDYVARFKAESIEAFEKVTLKRPDFAEAYYFLGYGYINLGLYVKAKLTWEEFVKLTTDEIKKKEILDRLSLLDEPVDIENGCNLILSGKFQEGIAVLSKYTDGKFKDWWPMWHYLGTAHMALEMLDDAIADFKKVLQLSPSNIDAMEELIRIYEVLGQEEMVKKYKNKVQIVRENAEKDRLQVFEEKNEKLS
jgi:tetratricopeptide (TPR) repeat protein